MPVHVAAPGCAVAIRSCTRKNVPSGRFGRHTRIMSYARVLITVEIAHVRTTGVKKGGACPFYQVRRINIGEVCHGETGEFLRHLVYKLVKLRLTRLKKHFVQVTAINIACGSMDSKHYRKSPSVYPGQVVAANSSVPDGFFDPLHVS